MENTRKTSNELSWSRSTGRCLGPELCFQSLPVEIITHILSFVEEEEIWQMRNLCRAFKSIYESSVRLKLYRLLPHIKSLIAELTETVENSHFSLEKLRLRQARKMLLLKFAYREALMFMAMVWRQSREPVAWGALCHPASQVINEFYSFANGVTDWARLLDFAAIQNRLRAWNAFQTTYTTRIEPTFSTKESAAPTPLFIQVMDVLECGLFCNWDSWVELDPATGAFDVEYSARFRNDVRRATPTTVVARAGASPGSVAEPGSERVHQSAAVLRYLRRSVSENTVTEFNRILEELEPLEVSIARTWGYNIPDQMVADMSQVYARVFQEYPRPWPKLESTENRHHLMRTLDYDMTQSQTHVQLSLKGIPRHWLPLSWTQDSLRSVRLCDAASSPQKRGGRRNGEAKSKGRRRRRKRMNTLTIEMTRSERRNRVLKSCVTVRGTNNEFRLTKTSRYYKLV